MSDEKSGASTLKTGQKVLLSGSRDQKSRPEIRERRWNRDWIEARAEKKKRKEKKRSLRVGRIVMVRTSEVFWGFCDAEDQRRANTLQRNYYPTVGLRLSIREAN
ncbi:hypothetical protein TNCV_620511 [Trichonephila clavipes]|nr:hypothetical protein TNCV_620511 [Trichonephila clavipes]